MQVWEAITKKILSSYKYNKNQTLSELIGDGFYDTVFKEDRDITPSQTLALRALSQTVSDMVDHLETKSAEIIVQNELSPEQKVSAINLLKAALISNYRLEANAESINKAFYPLPDLQLKSRTRHLCKYPKSRF